MAEVLGAGAAGAQLFETAIVILKKISKAYSQHKSLPAFIDRYRLELESIRDLIESVKSEKTLKTAKLSEPLSSLKNLEGKLCAWLAKVDPGNKKALRQFADQLIRGKDDRATLDQIMKDLDRAKQNLVIAFDMHHIRLTHDMKGAAAKKSIKSTRTSEKAKKHPGFDARSKSNSRGAKALTHSSDSEDDEISSSGETSSQESESDESDRAARQRPKIRRVRGNRATKGSIMFNSPLGKVDRYAHIDIIEIEENECEEDAEMFNYAIDEDGVALAQKMREARIAERRGEILWQREHGI